MAYPEAIYLFTHEFSNEMGENEVVAILRSTGKAGRA